MNVSGVPAGGDFREDWGLRLKTRDFPENIHARTVHTKELASTWAGPWAHPWAALERHLRPRRFPGPPRAIHARETGAPQPARGKRLRGGQERACEVDGKTSTQQFTYVIGFWDALEK